MEDWRLQGQEKYLLGALLSRKKYTKPRPDWDHDHCSFCWKKFSDVPGEANEGYTTADGYYWICDECFADFKEMFDWKLV
jgi:hypothetical protein